MHAAAAPAISSQPPGTVERSDRANATFVSIAEAIRLDDISAPDESSSRQVTSYSFFFKARPSGFENLRLNPLLFGRSRDTAGHARISSKS